MSSNRRLAATTVNLVPRLKLTDGSRRIMEASLRLFAERGYSGSSVREIARAVGMKPASLYAHYPSKEHILAELCRIGHDKQYELVRQAALAAGSDPRDQIAAYVRAHVGFHTSYPMLAVVSNSELHLLDANLGSDATRIRQESVNLMQEIIARGVDQAVFHIDDVWLAVAAIGGMGLRVAYWFVPDGESPAAQVADGYACFALRLLGADPREAA